MSRGTRVSAGDQLRALREAKGMGLRDVEKESRELAARLHVDECIVSHQYLLALEADRHKPSAFKLYTLSRLYSANWLYLLKLYGMGGEYVVLAELGLVTSSSEAQGMPASHEIIKPPETTPASDGLDQTRLLLGGADVLVQERALLPAGVARSVLYGIVGMKDLTMDPLIPPGSILQIDRGRRRVATAGWRSEFERPIYFLRTQQEYACGWCEVESSNLSLIPHPLSPVRLRQFRYPGEVEIVGRVTAVTISLLRTAEGLDGFAKE